MNAIFESSTSGIAAASSLSFGNTTFNVIDQNGEAWLRSKEIAQALGYADDKSINKIFSRYRDEFTDKMTMGVKLTTVTGEKETRIFSLRGAHLLAMFARTPVAKQFRKWVLDILDRHTKLTEERKGESIACPNRRWLLQWVDGVPMISAMLDDDQVIYLPKLPQMIKNGLLNPKLMHEVMAACNQVLDPLVGEILDLYQKTIATPP